MNRSIFRSLRPLEGLTLCAVLCLFGCAPAMAALLTYDSTDPANNTTTRNTWLNAIGISSPDYTVNFESGFTDGQNIHNTVIGTWLTISAPSGTTVTIESGSGSIDGSNPIGSFAAEFSNEWNGAALSFSTAVDYLGFHDIDKGAGTVTVYFVGGGSTTGSIDATGTSGDSAEFFGIYRNDQPGITGIAFSFDNASIFDWGIDNIEYGIVPVPEPGSAALVACALCFAAVAWRRLRR